MKIEFKAYGTCKMEDIKISEAFKYKAQVYIRCEPTTDYIRVHVQATDGPRLLAMNPQNGTLRGVLACAEVTRLRAKLVVCSVDDC